MPFGSEISGVFHNVCVCLGSCFSMSLLTYSPHSINIKSKDNQIDNHLVYFPSRTFVISSELHSMYFIQIWEKLPSSVLPRQLSPDRGAPVATKLKCPRPCSTAIYLQSTGKRPLSLLPPLVKNALGLQRGQKERGRKQERLEMPGLH